MTGSAIALGGVRADDHGRRTRGTRGALPEFVRRIAWRRLATAFAVTLMVGILCGASPVSG